MANLMRGCFRIAALVSAAIVLQLCFWVASRQDLTAFAHSDLYVMATEVVPTIEVAQLPQQARDMLNLIKRGGPFPYPKDGATFGNRERRLPNRARGYYKEYTVRTPGSRDRGARRIVAGADGEYYYTEDHYTTFKLIRGVFP